MGVWAHSRNVSGDRHLLVDHSRGTAELAKRFGAAFGAADLSYAAGLVHDIGKLVTPWQNYLLAAEAGIRLAKVDHKTFGAALLSRIALQPGWLICQGHHGGIPNLAGLTADDCAVDPALEAAAHRLLPELESLLAQPRIIPPEWLGWAQADPASLEMAVRLVHSTLVDADFLDTAAHFNATRAQVRPPADFTQLDGAFTKRLRAFLAGRTPSPVDALRAALLDECLAAAAGPQGVYRLPGPTGSGKTIAAAAFALSHAARHGMNRVVVAVPFLSITEQNAAVYRQLVGDPYVIEHHSGLAPQSDEGRHARSKYGVENWDAPFVITTTVQLFESLFSNRPSKTRKLHRLVNSVIILDEIQAIPTHVLPVILDGLRILHERFGTTVVLSSATQPTWDLLGPWRDAAALEVRDIVADPPSLYAGLRRSTVEWLDLATLDDVADLIATQSQAMMVVNTTANARDLSRLVRDREPEGTLHLSTRMYPAHRRSVLAEVRQRLNAGAPVRLVTTQLVEAGVDLDFPVVFRSAAPAENLSQARGRCNREGRLPSGRFVVVSSKDLSELPKQYATGISKTRQHFRLPGEDLDDPRAMRRYFADFFRTAGIDTAAPAALIQYAREAMRYAEVADRFRMIDDDSVSVVVGSAPEAARILEDLAEQVRRHGVPSPDRYRRLQDYAINLPRDHIRQFEDNVREEIHGVSVWRGPYDPLTGVTIDTDSPQDSVW